MLNIHGQKIFRALHKYSRQMLIAFLCAALSLLTLSAPSAHADSFNYAITYDANGGSGSIDPQTGTDVSVDLTANTFTYGGHTFAGWNDASDGSGTPYTDGQTISLAGDLAITLYAQWAPIVIAPLISVDPVISQAGVNGQWIGADIHLSSGQVSVSQGTWNNSPTSYSYQWYSCTAELGSSSSSIPLGCTAISSASATTSAFQITSDLFGNYLSAAVTATNSAGSTTMWTASSPEVIQSPSPSVDPSLSGTPQEGSILTVDPGTWDGFPTPTISYEWYDCTAQIVTAAGIVAPPTCSQIIGATSSTYQLQSSDIGFFVAAEVNGNYVVGAFTPFDPFFAPSTTTVVVPALPTHTVTFDPNGGTGTIAPEIASSSQSLTTNSFSYSGHTFTGWNTAVDGSGTPYADGASYDFTTGDTTLFAQWTPIPPCYVVVSGVLTDGTGCSGHVDIDNSVTTIGANAFLLDSALTSVVIPNGVTTIEPGAFESTSITTITVPNSVISIGQNAFAWDTSLISIVLPHGTYAVSDPRYHEISTGTFAHDTSLGSIVIPDNVDFIDDAAFTGDTSLTSIVIPDTVIWISNANNLLGGAFDGDTSLATVTIGSSVEIIGPYAFANDTVLTSITIPDSVTSIDTYAFAWNTSLSTVTIGKGVTSIDALTFDGDTSLASVSYCGLSAVVLNYSYPNGITPSCPNGHTVTFDSNTGSGSMLSETTDVATALTTNSFIKSGYTFAGWNDAADGSGNSYADGASYDFTQGDTTLYAQWNSNVTTYTISFQSLLPNSFITSGTNPNPTTLPAGSTYIVPGNPGNLFSAGGTFLGWYVDTAACIAASNCQNTFHMPGDSVVVSDDLILNSGWNANATLDYDGNSADGGIAPASQTTFDTQPDIVESNSFTKTGYHFIGWNTQQDGSGNSYSVGDPISLSTASYIFYAQWSANAVSHTVTFDDNGGTGTMAPETASSAQNLTSNGFSYSGHTFMGQWNTAPDGSGTTYNDGDSYDFTADLTLYAQWTYTVSFDANGGTGSMTDEVGGWPYYLTNNSFVRVGYTFTGWNTSADGTGTPHSDNEFLYISGDTTLYAQWSANSTQTITYSLAGGSGTVPTQSPVSQGASFNVAVGTGLTKAGFTFSNWNDGITTYAAGSTYTVGSSNITLTAQWTANPTQTIIYALNGGSGTVPMQSPVSQGASFTTATSTGLTKAGFSFASWSDGTSTYAASTTYTVGSSNITLTAQWSANPTQSITYSLNGGSGTLPTQSAVSQGASFVVAASTGLANAGYTFASWSDGITTYLPTSAYVVGTSNITLTAQWSANPTQTVTYALNGGSGTLPTQIPVNQGASFNVAAGTGLTKAGFTFNGWNDGATTYASGISYTVGTSNILLTAQWLANAARTVTYSLAGGSGTLPTQSAVSQGASFNVAASTGLTKAGFIFSNWSDGTSTYAAGASYTAGASSITLTAQWSANPTQTVTYALNGGTGTLPIQSPVSQGGSFIVAASTGLTKLGFTFAGWSDGFAIYQPGASFTVATSNTTLTAQWSTAVVTFDPNGGSGSMPNQAAGVTTALTLNTFTLTNDVFVNWNTSPSGSGSSYADGAVYPFTTSATLYAQWTLSPAVIAARAAAQVAAKAAADKAAADAAAAAQAAADKAAADKAAADAAAAAKAAADKAAADGLAAAQAAAVKVAADQAAAAQAAAAKAAADKIAADKAAAKAAADAAQALAAAKKNPSDSKLQVAAKDAGASSTVAKAAAAKQASTASKTADATAAADAKAAAASAAADAAATAQAAAAKAQADSSPNDAQFAAAASAAAAAKVAADQAAANATAAAKAAADQAAAAKTAATKAATAAGSNAIAVSKSSGGITPVKLNLPNNLAGKTVSVELAVQVNGKWTYKTIGSITLDASGNGTFKSKVPLPKGAVINIKSGNSVVQGSSVG